MTPAPPRRTSVVLSASHGFFGREGGVSAPPFESLNGGLSSGDVIEDVLKNRQRIAAALGADHLVSVKQTHSSRAVLVTGPFPHDQRPEGDALVTTVPGLALGATAADCVPILFDGGEVVAATHAGWRGSLGGIVESTVLLMEQQGARRDQIKAAIGPHLRAPHFEVRQDLIDQVLEKHPEATQHFVRVNAEQHIFDHTSFVVDRLRDAGIAPEHIDDVGGNTLAAPEEFFSYRDACRRGVQQFGQNLSGICLP